MTSTVLFVQELAPAVRVSPAGTAAGPARGFWRLAGRRADRSANSGEPTNGCFAHRAGP